MNTGKDLALLLCLLVGVLGEDCFAKTASPKTYVSEEVRSIVGGRKVLIVSPEATLAPTLAKNHIEYPGGQPTFYYSVPAEIAEYNKQVLEARAFIAPLHAALSGYDFEAKMRGALESVLNHSSWLHPQDIELTRNSRNDNLERELDESNTRQMLVLSTGHRAEYRYMCIVVSLQATILVRQVPRGKYKSARLSPDYIPYQMSFAAIVNLAGADPKDPQHNLDRWAADKGALARRAIDIGVDWVATRLASNLAETREENRKWSTRGDRKGVLANGTPGWSLSRDVNETVVFEPRSNVLQMETQVGAE